MDRLTRRKDDSQVAASHQGHMKKGIHYAVVFSASLAVAVGRILKAASVHNGMTPFVFDTQVPIEVF